MRRRTSVAVALVLGAAVPAASFVACVGDSPVPVVEAGADVTPAVDAKADVVVAKDGGSPDVVVEASPPPALVCQNLGVCTPGKQLCCVDTISGGCKDAGAPDVRVCDPNDPELRCSHPAHCGQGQVCCAARSTVLTNPPKPYNTTCETSCTGSGSFTRAVVCDPKAANPCAAGTCQSVVDAGVNLPNGYFVCK